MAHNSILQTDYIIIGAGITGLYCAYKMSLNGINKIVVIEKLNRIGGNIKSEFVKVNGKSLVQEEGGMRFYANNPVYHLVKELGLEDDIVEIKNGCDNNINYFRGIRFTDAKADNHMWHKSFGADLEEREKAPYHILNEIFFKVMKINNAIEIPRTLEEWQAVRNWMVKDSSGINRPLYEWNFKQLLLQFELNLNTIKMIEYSMGFEGLFCREWHSAYGFQSLLCFTLDHPPFQTLKHGLNQIPLALYGRIIQSGVQVKNNAEVFRVSILEGEFPVRVEFLDKDDGSTKVIDCRQLILAIPQISLIELANKNIWMRKQPNFDKYLDGIISQPITKIRLYFEKQWWRNLGFSNGTCLTDLRVGNIFISTPIAENQLEENTAQLPGSLMIYCDCESALYWHSLQATKSVYAPSIEPPKGSVLAKTSLVNVVMNQLNRVFQFPTDGTQQHPMSEPDHLIIPDWPVLVTYTFWGDIELGDSTHAWKVGVNDCLVSPRMYTLLGERIGIIGESYSIAQEWIEGALHHTDGYLRDVMKFKL